MQVTLLKNGRIIDPANKRDAVGESRGLVVNEAEQPFLHVVKGDATPEEIAALVTVIASMGAAAPTKPKPRSAWAHPARDLREIHRHGVGAWRASGLPR